MESPLFTGDIPTQTSSIGATWPPSSASHNRLKGFYSNVVDTIEVAERFITELEPYAIGIDGNESEHDRLTVRFVGSLAMVQHVSDTSSLMLEAAMPVRNSRDRHVAYLGLNAPTRVMDEDYLRKHTQLAIESVHRASLLNRSGKTVGDYTVGYFEPGNAARESMDTAADIVRLTELFQVFDYTADDVNNILTNPDCLLAWIRDKDGSIVSTSLAESATLSLEEGLIPQNYMITEITEAVTDPKHRGLGLYRMVSKALAGWLDERVVADIPQVIYGESNLSSPGVIIAARENGRHFSSDYSGIYLGNSNDRFGILEQNYKVQEPGDNRAYNDFAITFLP